MSKTSSRPTAREMLEAHRARGFQVACPLCGEAEADINLSLIDLSSCHCDACGEDFSVGVAIRHFEERLAAWRAVSGWIELAPGIAPPAPSESEG